MSDEVAVIIGVCNIRTEEGRVSGKLELGKVALLHTHALDQEVAILVCRRQSLALAIAQVHADVRHWSVTR